MKKATGSPTTWQWGARGIAYLDGLKQADLDYEDNAVYPSGTLAEIGKRAPSGFHAIPLDEIGPRKHR